MSFLLCSQDFHQFSDRMKNQPPGDGSGIVKLKGIFNEERVLFFLLQEAASSTEDGDRIDFFRRTSAEEFMKK